MPKHSEIQYYHGGAPGICVGKMILPPNETKAFTFASRSDRIYVITNLLQAVIYAAMHPSRCGVVYLVKPIGRLESDPDCKIVGLQFSCERAVVLQEVDVPPQMMLAAKAAIMAA